MKHSKKESVPYKMKQKKYVCVDFNVMLYIGLLGQLELPENT